RFSRDWSSDVCSSDLNWPASWGLIRPTVTIYGETCMIPDFPNLPDDLQRRLDRAVPPDTRYLPPAKDDDPLVEAARRLAETPPRSEEPRVGETGSGRS